MGQQMVIFSRTFDFLDWLIPRTLDFPRSQRFVVTKRLQDAALDFYERITELEFRQSMKRWADAQLNQVP